MRLNIMRNIFGTGNVSGLPLQGARWYVYLTRGGVRNAHFAPG